MERKPGDPLLARSFKECIRENDFVILLFNDGRQLFARCTKSWNGKGTMAPLKINKRNYSTGNLIGLPYGTVLEVENRKLVPLPPTENLRPELITLSDVAPQEQDTDNRHIVDDNKAQALEAGDLLQLRETGVHGATIVKKIIENSSTFDQKTDFSQQKYIARKQMKYQQRCRVVRCTPSSVCEAYYWKDAKKAMNLRQDSLAQILSYANVAAGCQTLVIETCLGIVTGAVAARMGGYGKIFSVYNGQQHSFTGVLDRYNLTFPELSSIKWLHSGDVFGVDSDQNEDEDDQERIDRDAIEWPCPLQEHTKTYIGTLESRKEKLEFLAKRSARFTRKLTRHTPLESKAWFEERRCDSVIIVARYDPTETLLSVFKNLSPSCPFVVFCEYLEPLTSCFQVLQEQNKAINLRLSSTWAREYQVLPGRTHPNMNMSQSGGFILTGIKLDETFGVNEIEEDLLQEIRKDIGGRRARFGSKLKNRKKSKPNGKDGKKNEDQNERSPKRQKIIDE